MAQISTRPTTAKETRQFIEASEICIGTAIRTLRERLPLLPVCAATWLCNDYYPYGGVLPVRRGGRRIVISEWHPRVGPGLSATRKETLDGRELPPGSVAPNSAKLYDK